MRMIAGCIVEKGRLPNSLSKLLNGQWGDLALSIAFLFSFSLIESKSKWCKQNRVIELCLNCTFNAHSLYFPFSEQRGTDIVS